MKSKATLFHRIALAAVFSAAVSVAAAHTQPYAGQQQRRIKALSTQEVQAFRDGAGHGFARAAELNSHPGPMHVLELATHLELSAAQRTAFETLMARHKAQARALGAEVLRLEAELDALFADSKPSIDEVEAKTAEVGRAHARYRASHLTTHVAATALLTPAQIARYDELRGYRPAAGAPAVGGGAP
jgi:Spy/CpxP family protein refolding chaperone